MTIAIAIFLIQELYLVDVVDRKGKNYETYNRGAWVQIIAK